LNVDNISPTYYYFAPHHHTAYFFSLKTTNQIQTPIAYCIGKSFKGGILCLGWKEGRKEARIQPPSIKLKHPCDEEEEEEEEMIIIIIIIIIMTMKSETQK